MIALRQARDDALARAEAVRRRRGLPLPLTSLEFIAGLAILSYYDKLANLHINWVTDGSDSQPLRPGAGIPPPELAGRDDLLKRVRITLERARLGRPAKSVLAVGLRGVGKTVILLKSSDYAESKGMLVTRVEAPESRSLPALLAPGLRLAMIELARKSRARELARRALRGLAGFAGALKVKYRDIEVGLDFDPEPGLADNGDLELDLQALLQAVGEACASADTGLAMFVDELQYVDEDELAALIVALHRTAQRGLPVTLVGAGLPQLRGRMGRAKSYAERLFDFSEVGPLSWEAASTAIVKRLGIWEWTSSGKRSKWSSGRPRDTPTFSRSGGSTSGMRPRDHRSPQAMCGRRRH